MDELHPSLTISDNSQIPLTAAAVARTASSTSSTVILLGLPRFRTGLSAVEVVPVLGQTPRWPLILQFRHSISVLQIVLVDLFELGFVLEHLILLGGIEGSLLFGSVLEVAELGTEVHLALDELLARADFGFVLSDPFPLGVHAVLVFHLAEPGFEVLLGVVLALRWW